MDDDVEPDPVHWKPRVALALWVMGLALIGVGFAHVEGAGVWFRSGCWAWVPAYFLVLLDNWQRRLPIESHGGMARYARGAARHALHYAFMLLWGLGATGVLLAFTLLGDSPR